VGDDFHSNGHRLAWSDRESNPRAVELGLVDRARPVVASDPRVAPSDAVVFYWVPPANP